MTSVAAFHFMLFTIQYDTGLAKPVSFREDARSVPKEATAFSWRKLLLANEPAHRHDSSSSIRCFSMRTLSAIAPHLQRSPGFVYRAPLPYIGGTWYLLAMR